MHEYKLVRNPKCVRCGNCWSRLPKQFVRHIRETPIDEVTLLIHAEEFEDAIKHCYLGYLTIEDSVNVHSDS